MEAAQGRSWLRCEDFVIKKHKQQLLCYHLLFILTFLVDFVVSVCLKVNPKEICEERLFFIIFRKT